LGLKRFVDVLISGSVIGYSVGFNFLVFSVGAAALGFGVGFAMGDEEEGTREALGIVVCLMTLLLTIGLFAVLRQPIGAISDTLLICFAEAPQQLETSAADLKEALVNFYETNVGKED
jgi:hypothetical protein